MECVSGSSSGVVVANLLPIKPPHVDACAFLLEALVLTVIILLSLALVHLIVGLMAVSHLIHLPLPSFPPLPPIYKVNRR